MPGTDLAANISPQREQGTLTSRQPLLRAVVKLFIFPLLALRASERERRPPSVMMQN